MNILIADDEPLARERLRSLLQEIGQEAHIVDEAENGDQVIERCRQGDVDLVLLDIRMPGTDGMQAAGILLELEQPPAVIFTTAYSECAVDAFEKHAVDYLLKPIKKDRLEQALVKAKSLSRVQLQAVDERQNRDLSNLGVCIRFRGELHRIGIDRILFFRAESKYVMVRHLEGESLLEESLKSLEQRFGDHFMRIHRNALINLDFLTGLKKDHMGQACVELRGYEQECLEISRRHLPAVRQWLKGRSA